MICGWKRFAQAVLGRQNKRRHEPRFASSAEVQQLEERTVLSVTTLAVNNDTYLTNHTGQNPAANLGGLGELRIYKDSAEVYRTLVQADVGSLASGATVNSATLELYHTGGFTFDRQPMTVTLYALTHAWVEGTGVLDSVAENGASWLNAAVGDPWTTAGGDLGAAIASATLPSANSAGWVQFNITSAVQAWRNGAANFGLAFVVTAGGSHTQYTFASSESANATLRPRLAVDVADPVIPPSRCEPRSAVAVFVLSQEPGGSHGRDRDWSSLNGPGKSTVAHQIQDVAANQHSSGNHDDDSGTITTGLPRLGKC